MVMTHYQHGQDELSEKIFQERYALHDKETFQEACERLANAAASVEAPNKIAEWRDKFYEELVNCRFVPGGRIWYACGRPKATMLNCFALGTEDRDSREGWGDLITHSIVIGGQGGGLGTNYSGIRPRGSAIRGTGGKSTGSVSLMRIVNTTAEVIEGGGGRRSAHMAILSITHPDLLEFIDSKLKEDELNMMNISVAFDNISPEEFFEMVENNQQYDLVWHNDVYQSVKAKTIWNKVINNFLNKGEPGVMNLHYANQMNNLAYHGSIIGSNPCGEIMMLSDNVCNLGSLILPNFFKRKALDLKQLDRSIRRAVRFQDNILEITPYPTKKIAEEARAIRRIGLGVTGLHDLLLMNGLRYGSDESIDFTDKLFKFIKNKSYETSTYIAAEKGSFAKFDSEKFLAGGFSKTLKESLRSQIQEYGLRNCALNTVAPTGTISLLVGGCSNGCEPIFGPAHMAKRWVKKDDKSRKHNVVEELVFHHLFDKAMSEGHSVDHFESVDSISIEDHFKMQHTIQKHIDQSISKTILLPSNKDGELTRTTTETFKECFKKYFPELKGITVYVQGSRQNEPIVPLSIEDAKEKWHTVKKKKVGSESLNNCQDGKCDL